MNAKGKYKNAGWECEIRSDKDTFVVQWDITSDCIASSYTLIVSKEAMEKWAAGKSPHIYFPVDDGKYAFLYMPAGCMLHYEKNFRFGFMTPHTEGKRTPEFVRSLLLIDGNDVDSFYRSDVSRMQQLFADSWDKYVALHATKKCKLEKD